MFTRFPCSLAASVWTPTHRTQIKKNPFNSPFFSRGNCIQTFSHLFWRRSAPQITSSKKWGEEPYMTLTWKQSFWHLFEHKPCMDNCYRNEKLHFLREREICSLDRTFLFSICYHAFWGVSSGREKQGTAELPGTCCKNRKFAIPYPRPDKPWCRDPPWSWLQCASRKLGCSGSAPFLQSKSL